MTQPAKQNSFDFGALEEPSEIFLATACDICHIILMSE
jgi:hypothetical protein